MENMDEDDFPRLYSLTAYTGQKASDGRTKHYGIVELRTQFVKVVLLAALPSAVLALVASLFMGTVAILVFLLVESILVFLVENRSRQGMRQRIYRHMLDEYAAKNPGFYLAGKRIDIDQENRPRRIVKASKPVGVAISASARTANIDVHDLFVSDAKNSKRKKSPTAKKSRKS